ncbi:gliding motility protein GldL [Pedobacter xixiisoli]|uniref:Gliding motility-associated protein GldL n=1 Tax=Pedobacter xixiisoli TaxID=1476464 RepID=A0A286AF25_9SPHI|nr:gliding motility protein GldL [Pedobacter xixiisoli]SOD20491.1 gliding motility-associated protein GldL [Pedobacter xixiisoli]
MAGKFATQEAKLHLATSVGAAIVIVGALFKILHLGGIWGSIMIGVGLGVEAFLFLLGGFFPPHADVEWDKVYPQLRKDGKPTPQDAIPQAAPVNVGATGALDKLVNEKIGPELIESLGNGLRTFGDKVANISKVADASIATTEFTDKVKGASDSLGNMNNAFGKATEQLAALGASHADSKAYHEQVNNLAKNLSALNAVYELELQDSSAHLKSMNKFYQNLALTMNNFNDSMEDSKQFKEEVGKLAKNLSSLNAIYGNMLTAMNQPRA